jgi:D-alanyl-D-alanine carboxypeptidase
LQKHAHEYGFILRYPRGKEWITGYSYEPWHYRYVGTDVAKIIYEKGITYEEYYADYVVGSEFK